MWHGAATMMNTPPPTSTVLRRRRRRRRRRLHHRAVLIPPSLVAALLLLCPTTFHLAENGGYGGVKTPLVVVGLVAKVVPIASGGNRRPASAPMRGLGGRNNAPMIIFNSPSDATTIVTESSPRFPVTSNDATSDDATSDDDATTTAGSTSSSGQGGNAASIPRQTTKQQRGGVWLPPSQRNNPGRIFSIQQPQDLLDFVIEDERLSVVFDMRYRRLASQFGDDQPGTRDNVIVKKRGRARFAEMQYDNPNNKEMCQLLNATKLPYILMYKGSRGKVDEFQCSPAQFQRLIDAVNELADPQTVLVDGGTASNGAEGSENFVDELNEVTDTSSSKATSEAATAPVEGPLWTGNETIDELKQQLENESAEKFNMFEVMKAQIEYDKGYILKLETGVETQRSMLEARDGELSTLRSGIMTKEEEIQSLSNELKQQKEENQRAKQDLLMYQTQVSQLTKRISEIEGVITSLELESSFNEKSVREKERQLLRHTQEWEEERSAYEKERSSIRKLALLGAKRVGRGVRNLLLRLRGTK
ncbi:hypothetical protein ACHAXA_003848 [Cyclostephanos tholiformis]|uniref:Uncharacterized protein n=1 Tax=Cyclostephanos tholiformis TaxID=382380 RepID=A0ABD3R5T5_9STRA